MSPPIFITLPIRRGFFCPINTLLGIFLENTIRTFASSPSLTDSGLLKIWCWIWELLYSAPCYFYYSSIRL
jgi:hypothetical protein